METKKHQISITKKLVVGLIITIILFSSLLYLYHNHWKDVYVVDNVPTSLTGVGIIVIMSITLCSIIVLVALLFGALLPYQSESEKKIKNLSDSFVNVTIKDFDSFPLSKFISRDDISCIAKLDENGKVSYSFNLKAKICQTDDYELFLKHFDI